MEQLMTGNDIRRQFLEYFKKHNHKIVRSSSLVPHDDPTLLFTNAGMVQFKRTFLGEEKKNYARAATSQKCVRAGGKHNDLENIGYTARHHTFFEMLGNFSFGNYFKEKAIEFAWDLLVNGYNLPEEKLWVSVYTDDDAAYDLWHKNIGVPEDRIVRFGKKDNFWSMGDVGPCGPCSEILIDRGEGFKCGQPGCKVGCECDRYLEIWNLVFMQFNRDQSGKMTPLPKPSIDTGMGLERIVSVIQNVSSNYETDLILPIIKKVESLSKKSIGESKENDVSMKVIADHSRAAAFLIGDGILPSNEGRGYVLRRILRRAIRYGRHIGLTRPFLHETSKVVMDIMKPVYPELSDAAAFITKVIKNEEVRFSETLDHGLKVLNDTLSDMREKGQNKIPGQIIFKLYDTYGFPLDVVRDVIRDEKFTIDEEGFNNAMQKQRAQSRSVATFSEIHDAYKNLSAKGIKPEFVGYGTDHCASQVLVLMTEGNEVKEASKGLTVDVVTKASPFYGKSGGQVGDTGMITGHDLEMKVLETIKEPTGLIIHRGKIVAGSIRKGEKVDLEIDLKNRNAIARNHTATHILHVALREVLGDHVKQAGSFVASDRLRFDFTHFSQVDRMDLDKIEAIVNKHIRDNKTVHTEEMDAEKAFKSGATALFEEKYGDRVRVVSISDFSKELCGGTHTKRTGDIGLFKITEESSIASGTRRIEALTGNAALEYTQQTINIVKNISLMVREKPETLTVRIEKILSSRKSIEKELEKLKNKLAETTTDTVKDDLKTINGINVLAKKVSAGSPAALRDLADKFKEKIKSGIVVIGSVAGSKVLLVALVTKDLVDRYHAGNIVKQTAAIVGGGGGGRADMAQAGGTMPEKLDQAIDHVYRLVEKI